MLQTQLNGLPSLGYVLKFNNTRLNWTGKEPEICSKIVLLARAGMRQKSGIVK